MAKSKSKTNTPDMPQPQPGDDAPAKTDKPPVDNPPAANGDGEKSDGEKSDAEKSGDSPALDASAENERLQAELAATQKQMDAANADLAADNARLKAELAGCEKQLLEATQAIAQLHEAADMMQAEYEQSRRQGDSHPQSVPVVVRRKFDRGEYRFQPDQPVAQLELCDGLTLNSFVDLVKDGFLKDACPKES